MDTITLEDLKYYYPLTHRDVCQHGTKFFLNPKTVNIRTFLERNGYSICVTNILDTEKYVPSVVYRGSEVGNNRKSRTNPYDFEPVTIKKAMELALFHALKDYEENCKYYICVNGK